LHLLPIPSYGVLGSMSRVIRRIRNRLENDPINDEEAGDRSPASSGVVLELRSLSANLPSSPYRSNRTKQPGIEMNSIPGCTS
jgi:hypothetical protein